RSSSSVAGRSGGAGRIDEDAVLGDRSRDHELITVGRHRPPLKIPCPPAGVGLLADLGSDVAGMPSARGTDLEKVLLLRRLLQRAAGADREAAAIRAPREESQVSLDTIGEQDRGEARHGFPLDVEGPKLVLETHDDKTAGGRPDPLSKQADGVPVRSQAKGHALAAVVEERTSPVLTAGGIKEQKIVGWAPNVSIDVVSEAPGPEIQRSDLLGMTRSLDGPVAETHAGRSRNEAAQAAGPHTEAHNRDNEVEGRVPEAFVHGRPRGSSHPTGSTINQPQSPEIRPRKQGTA